MVYRCRVSIILLVLGLLPAVALAGTINLPQTGQTTSYATGDDGYYQAGVAWPNPRFTVNADQTVTDNLTGLAWAKDAGTPTVGSCTGGIKTWQAALNYVACLNTQNYLGYSDWRLPNVNELESLSNAQVSNLVTWLNGQGFSNVPNSFYWSSTTFSISTGSAWEIYIFYGDVTPAGKPDYQFYVLPVRSGQVGAFSNSFVWQTGQTTSYATEDDGDIKAGVAWPSPRFVDNSDQTVTDNLTGLVWAKDAGTPTVGSCIGGVMNWQSAFNYVECLNNVGYLGHSDWRLPNRKEHMSIIDREMYSPSLPYVNPFTNVLSSNYWTSTTYVFDTSKAWYFFLNNGDTVQAAKSDNLYVWPVRTESTPNPTSTPIPTPTATPTPTPTATPTPSPTTTPTPSPTITPAPSATPSPAPTPVVVTDDTGKPVTVSVASTATIASVSSTTTPDVNGLNLSTGNSGRLPLGTITFTLTNVQPNVDTQVIFYLPQTVNVNRVFKYGPTPTNAASHWYDFTCDKSLSNKPCGEVNVLQGQKVVILHLTDGATGDNDLTVNGTITDPVAFVQDVATVPTLNEYGIIILMGLSCVVLMREKNMIPKLEHVRKKSKRRCCP